MEILIREAIGDKSFNYWRFTRCHLCYRIKKHPIQLPCNNIICESHLNHPPSQNLADRAKFFCILCNSFHIIPENGFSVNNFQENYINLKQSDPDKFLDFHQKCSEFFDLSFELDHFFKMNMEPSNIIEEKFLEYRNIISTEETLIDGRLEKVKALSEKEFDIHKEHSLLNHGNITTVPGFFPPVDVNQVVSETCSMINDLKKPDFDNFVKNCFQCKEINENLQPTRVKAAVQNISFKFLEKYNPLYTFETDMDKNQINVMFFCLRKF